MFTSSSGRSNTLQYMVAAGWVFISELSGDARF